MTNQEAIAKMKYCKRAYQMLIDEKSQKGILVGKGYEGEWKSDTPIDEAYKDMRDACDMAIKALTFRDKAEVVISQLRADRDRLENVLEKITAEIDEQIKLYNKESDDFGIVYGLKFAQTIISNYTKGEDE